jgi:hypothetical protein
MKKSIKTLCVGCLCVVVLFGLSFAIAPEDSYGQEPYALIYNGPVAAEEGPEAVAAIAEQVGLSVKFVSDIAELPTLLQHAAVFIIGGTEDDLNPLINAFTQEVTTALTDYLRNGGRYLGICGGGFMASTGWEEGESFVKTLGIIPAESGDFDEDDEPRILPIRWLGETHSMYFQAGPTFELTENPEDVSVFAYYEDGRIAGLMSSYGKGKAAVCGPHPEAPESWGDEAADGEDWTAVTDLAVGLLQELLSDHPVKTE